MPSATAARASTAPPMSPMGWMAWGLVGDGWRVGRAQPFQAMAERDENGEKKAPGEERSWTGVSQRVGIPG